MEGKPQAASKKLLEGAVILSAAGILVKLLSAVYRIPFQNIVGDTGFYIYQQVYPFYGIAFTLAAAGFPMVLSNMIAGQADSGPSASIQEKLAASFLLLSGMGVCLFLLLFTGADWLAEKMGDGRLAFLLKLTAFSYLFLPFSAFLRGCYQGKQEMMPTAVSQVSEQFVRVATILCLSIYFVGSGASLYKAGAGAVAGSITGGAAGLAVLLYFALYRTEIGKLPFKRVTRKDFKVTAKALFIQGIAFCLVSLILVLLQLVDSLNLYSLLCESGLPALEAKTWKGVYDRGQPLIQLGAVAANSISLSLVPLIANYAAKGLDNALYDKTRLALKISTAAGGAASIGLICLIKPINTMLFTDSKGTTALVLLSLTIFLSSILMTMASIMQSIGRTSVSTSIILLGLLLKAWLNHLLVPHWQITGAAAATLVSFLAMAVCFYVLLRRMLARPLDSLRQSTVTWAAIAGMAAVLMIYNKLFDMVGAAGYGRLSAMVHSLTGVALGAAVFVLIIFKAKLFEDDELALLPGGGKLIEFQRKKNKE